MERVQQKILLIRGQKVMLDSANDRQRNRVSETQITEI